jgi:hypothetical protein
MQTELRPSVKSKNLKSALPKEHRLLSVRERFVIPPAFCGCGCIESSLVAFSLSSFVALAYGFDVELLFVAQKRGYRIAEVAVNWADQPGSKVRVFRDGLQMVCEVWSVRRNYHRGLYAPR